MPNVAGGSVSEEYVRIARIYRQGQHNVLRAFVEAISDEREV